MSGESAPRAPGYTEPFSEAEKNALAEELSTLGIRVEQSTYQPRFQDRALPLWKGLPENRVHFMERALHNCESYLASPNIYEDESVSLRLSEDRQKRRDMIGETLSPRCRAFYETGKLRGGRITLVLSTVYGLSGLLKDYLDLEPFHELKGVIERADRVIDSFGGYSKMSLEEKSEIVRRTEEVARAFIEAVTKEEGNDHVEV